jgi:hypothetical protein
VRLKTFSAVDTSKLDNMSDEVEMVSQLDFDLIDLFQSSLAWHVSACFVLTACGGMFMIGNSKARVHFLYYSASSVKSVL